MKDVHKESLKVFLVVITFTFTLYQTKFIHAVDVLLTLIFSGIIWFAIGAPWSHFQWGEKHKKRWHRFAPKLYSLTTIFAITIAIVNLTIGSAMTKYAPQRLDNGIAEIATARFSSSEIVITNVLREDCLPISAFIGNERGSFVAASTPTSIVMAPGISVLKKVLEEIDLDLRIRPAFVIAGIIMFLLFGLFVIELATEFETAQPPSSGPKVDSTSQSGWDTRSD